MTSLILSDSIELLYLNIVANGLVNKVNKHGTLRMEQLMTRLEITLVRNSIRNTNNRGYANDIGNERHLMKGPFT